MRVGINLAGFQIGWWACVLGAAEGSSWAGPLAVSVVLAIHLWLVSRRAGEVVLLAGAGAVGYVADSVLVLNGFLGFPGDAAVGRPAPVWLVSLWLNFAALLNISLRWLQSRLRLAVLFGAVGGPLAYLAGDQLGAFELAASAGAIVAVAVEWALAFPALLAMASWTRARIPVRTKTISRSEEMNP